MASNLPRRDVSAPSSLEGEKAGMRGAPRSGAESKSPLTLTLSPARGGEGIGEVLSPASGGERARYDAEEGAEPVRVRTLGRGEEALWDAFVERCPEATFFHRAGWREVIERAFAHPTWFLYAENSNGAIEGVLPLARVRSRLFGDSLTSLPFCVYGGMAADTGRAVAALDDAAMGLADDLGVGHLEYRHTRRRFPERPQKDRYVTFRRAIDPDPEVNLKAIPRKQRAMVRKGIKAGLEPVLDDDTRRFFRAYSESVHQLGTPVFARHYFDILRQVFGDDCNVLTVTRSGQLVASVLSFYFRDQVLPYYGGGVAAARGVAGNDYLYWALMEHARERGCRLFDYGRSKLDTGSYSFKKHWGFEPEPLYYECRLVRAGALPDNSPQNPRYQRLIALWRRLPLPVVNAIGPHIVRRIG